MAEYIKKGATVGILEAMSRNADCECIKKRLEKAAKRVSTIPAADVAPVVHGVWEREPASYWRWTPSGAVAVTRTTYRCGLCGRGTAVKFNYCPNCGAKMDGGDNHETD